MLCPYRIINLISNKHNGLTLLEAQYVRFMLINSEDLGNETFEILIQR